MLPRASEGERKILALFSGGAGARGLKERRSSQK
jgi:hypothetical protein